jgi:anti-sigma B factor antagonist
MATNPHTPTLELQIETEKTPAETIFRCAGKLTSSTAAQFREPIHQAIMDSKRVVLDLSDVKNMDSSGLGVLVSLWVSAKRAGCDLQLISLSERVRELLHLTALDKLFAASRFPDTPSF